MKSYRKGQEVCEELQEGTRNLCGVTGRDKKFVRSYRKGQEICEELRKGQEVCEELRKGKEVCEYLQKGTRSL